MAAKLRGISRGFTLLEVLIALVIFSLGCLGLAAMLVVSMKTNNVAAIRTQASFLAQSMAERMSTNVIAVYGGSYALAFAGGAATAATCDPTTLAAGCPPAGMASFDIQAWENQLLQSLPNPTATIACNVGGTIVAPPVGQQLAESPPYNDYCTIQIFWKENAEESNMNVAQNQSFAWAFQP